MTDLIQKAFDAMNRLPIEQQEDIARLILRLSEQPSEIEPLDAEVEQAIAEAEAEYQSGARVSDEAIQAFWKRNGV